MDLGKVYFGERRSWMLIRTLKYGEDSIELDGEKISVDVSKAGPSLFYSISIIVLIKI